MSTGVVIGRFQVSELHMGHRALIDSSLSNNDKTIILVGVPFVFGTRRNPLDFITVKSMIEDYVKIRPVVILPIRDCPTDQEWSAKVDEIVHYISPFDTVTLYHGRDSMADSYSGRYQLKSVSVESKSGTEDRNVTGKTPLRGRPFRAGMIYSTYNRWPRINPTVDIVCTRGRKILLGSRKGTPHLVRFPGGFVDNTDVSLEEAACRELKEEAGLVARPHEMKFLGSSFVSDPRSEEDNKILTTIFHYKVHPDVANSVVAGDDLASVGWYPIDEVSLLPGGTISWQISGVTLAPEHESIFDIFDDRADLSDV